MILRSLWMLSGEREINQYLLEIDWGNMEKANAEEVQQMITDTYEEAVIKIAKPKKAFNPNKKRKPPREIVKP